MPCMSRLVIVTWCLLSPTIYCCWTLHHCNVHHKHFVTNLLASHSWKLPPHRTLVGGSVNLGWMRMRNWVSVIIDIAIGHYHHHCHDKPSSRPVGTSASMAQHFSLPSCGKQYVTSDCRLEHDHQAHHHHVLLVHPTRSPGLLCMHTEPAVLDKSLEPIAQSLERGEKFSLLEN